MREFGSAVKAAAQRDAADDGTADEGDAIEFKIMGREMVAAFPGSGAIAYLSMILAGGGNILERAGGMMNFVISMLDDEDRQYVKRLLLDSQSGFDAEDVEELVSFFVEEWTARPTEAPAASTHSRQGAGPKSTASSRRSRQTPSTSTRAGS